jgi:PAS domain S-box-containing protein
MTTNPATIPNKPTADGESYADFLHQITLDLLRRQDIGELLGRIIEYAATLLDAPYGAIMLYEEQALVARAYTSNQPYLAGDRVQRGEASIAWRAFDSHEPVVVDDYGAWPEQRGIYEAAKLTAVADFPILKGEQCLGVLAMARNVPNSPFSEQDKRRGMQFSQLAALVLDNAQLHATAAQELAERQRVEQALRASETRYRKSSEASLDAFYLLESVRDGRGEIIDFRIVEVNENAVREIGLTREQLVGANICELFPVNRTNGFFEQYKQVVLTGQPLVQEYMIPAEHTAPGWYYHQAVKVDDGLAINNKDITQRKQMEAALREQHAELDHFFMASLDLLTIADTNGHFVKINQEWEHVLGYSIEELQGRSFLDFVHPDDLQSTLEAIAVLRSDQPVVNFINRYRTKDGRYRSIEWRSHPRGNLIYAAARDITNRLEAEATLQQTAAKLAKAQTIGQMGNWEGDLITQEVIWSEQMYDLFGMVHKPVNLSRTDFRKAVHPDDQQLADRALQSVLAGGAYDYQYRVVLPNGRLRYMHSRAELIRSETGDPWRLVGTTQDITERKETELALQKLYQVMATPHETIAAQLTNALKVGTELLDLPLGVISRIEEEDYLILHIYTAEGLIQPGDHYPFEETVCEITYAADELVAIEHIGASAYRTHPCYLKYGVEAYAGVPLYVEGKRFGTLNFSNTAVRPTPFTQAQKEFLLLMGQWVSTQLAQQLATDKLEASEEQFRTLVRNIPGITYRTLLDGAWTMTFISEATHTITGYPASDFLHNQGRNWNDLIHPDDKQWVEETARQSLTEQQLVDLEYRIIHADGQTRWVHEIGRIIFDHAGQPLYLDGLISDITAEKAATERLRILDRAIAYSSAGVVIVNTRNYPQVPIEYANEAFTQITGYTQAELIGKSVRDLYDHIASTHTGFDVLRAGFREKRPVQAVLPALRQDGTPYWIEIWLAPVFDHNGQPTHFVSTQLDVTRRQEAEERLRDSQTFLENILNTLTAHVVIVNEQGVIIKTNQSWRNYAKANGLTWDDYGLGRNYLQVLAAVEGDGVEESQTVLKGIQRVLKEEIPSYSYTYPCHSPTEQSWYTMEATRLVRPEGPHLVLAHHDVTKPILAEAELHNAQTFLSTVLDLAPIAISTLNVNHEFHSVNRQWEFDMQISREQALGRSITDLLPLQMAQKYLSDYEWVAENGVLIQEEAAKTPHGLRWFHNIQFPLHNPSGEVEFVGTLAVDITERKKIEKELERYIRELTHLTAEQKIILDNTAAAIFLQQDTHIIWANPATENLLGYSQTEIEALPNVAYHISPEAHAQFDNTVTPPLARGEAVTAEIQIRRQDGSTCWVTITGQALNPQRVHRDGVLWIMQDITERKTAEATLHAYAEQLAIARDQALEASRYKTLLLNKVSHELRTPLSGILGYAELLRDGMGGKLLPDQAEFVSQIVVSIHHLNSLITDLLDQAQIEQGALKLQEYPIVVPHMVKFLHSLLYPFAAEKGLELIFESQMPEVIMGDEKRLRQIIINLANNALKFTETGMVSIYLRQVDPISWRIDVTDTGPGIAPEVQSKIFDSFWQVDGSTNSLHKGYGLGLSIVKSLTQLMNGSVEVESAPGRGSTFTVWLPLEIL